MIIIIIIFQFCEYLKPYELPVVKNHAHKNLHTLQTFSNNCQIEASSNTLQILTNNFLFLFLSRLLDCEAK